NTVKLLVEGWKGLWIEASSQSAGRIREHFSDFLSSRNLCLLEKMVTAENINSLLTQAGFVGDIDLLSIDIDFNDYWVWRAIEAARPRVVMMEYNASLRPPLSLVVPYSPTSVWGGGNSFGAFRKARSLFECLTAAPNLNWAGSIRTPQSRQFRIETP